MFLKCMKEVRRVKNERLKISAAGLGIGLIAVVLVLLGNPANMGFCIACFLRDTAGALGMHRAAVVQYVRPEIIGLVLGAAAAALAFGEFRAKGGSSPVLRFIIGFFVMVGALAFLGCPLRMVLRLAGGDLNALPALAGFIVGIGGGVFFLKKGFSLGATREQKKIEGLAFSVWQIALLVVLVCLPVLLIFSESGPGSMRAPVIWSLAAGLAVGFLAQRTRICMAGGIRDVMLFGDWTLALGFLGIFVGALILNIITGKFSLGFAGQPVAHTQWLWNFLGMVVVGLGSAMLGGCPLRQLILAGEGNSDSAVAVIGMTVGAAFCHNWGLASSADGSTPRGRIAVIVGLVVLVIIACVHCFAKKEEKA